VKEDGMGRICSTQGVKLNAYRGLGLKARRKNLTSKSWTYVGGWGGNIKMDLREIGWGVMDWIYVSLNRDQWRALMNAVMNLRVP
jgi:hypothetical protein